MGSKISYCQEEVPYQVYQNARAASSILSTRDISTGLRPPSPFFPDPYTSPGPLALALVYGSPFFASAYNRENSFRKTCPNSRSRTMRT